MTTQRIYYDFVQQPERIFIIRNFPQLSEIFTEHFTKFSLKKLLCNMYN